MRVWDLPPGILCRNHLLAQHNEIHTLWSVISGDRKGWARHPETMRWRGKLAALHERHERTAEEMARRGYNHNSPLLGEPTGSTEQTAFVDSVERQRELLRAKECNCDVS